MKIRYNYIFKKNGWILKDTEDGKIVFSIRAYEDDHTIAIYNRRENSVTFEKAELDAEEVLAVLEAMGVLNEV